MRRAMFFLSHDCRLVGTLLVAATVAGCQPEVSPPTEPEHAPDVSAPDEPSQGLPTAAVGEPKDPATTRSAATFALCKGETVPRFGELRILGEVLLWVHCGRRISLLWAPPRSPQTSPADDSDVPLFEVMRLEHTALRPDASALAGQVVAGKLDQDAHSDLMLGIPVVDGRGAPGGGAVYVLRGAPPGEGPLLPPERLFGAHALTVALAHNAKAKQPELLVVHGEDARADRHNELWHMNTGPEMTRGRVVALPLGGQLLAAIDLDGDGQADPVIADSRGGAQPLLSTPAPTPTTATEPAPDDPAAAPSTIALIPGWPTAGVRSAATGDLDGDGATDMLLLTERLLLARGRPNPAASAPAPLPLDGLACAPTCGHTVQIVDVDRDSRADVVLYQHPEVVVFRQTDALRFERRPLATLVGDEADVMETRLLDLDQDNQLDLLALTRKGDAFALSVLRGVTPGTAVETARKAVTLPQTPLAQHYRLPN